MNTPRYLHKDFHGALSCGFQYVKDNYGYEALRDYWRQVAVGCYGRLIEAMKTRGLSALEDHLRDIFTIEGAEFELYQEGDSLVLKVQRCPAIHHMKEFGYPIAEDFCEHTRVVNGEICRQAGFEAECDYDQGAGRCVQRFRRAMNGARGDEVRGA